MKMEKRILAVFLAFVLVLPGLPAATAHADESAAGTGFETAEELTLDTEHQGTMSPVLIDNNMSYVAYYRYTPEETGIYKLILTDLTNGQTTSFHAALYDSNKMNLSDTMDNGAILGYLHQGLTYYFEISCPMPLNFTVLLQKNTGFHACPDGTPSNLNIPYNQTGLLQVGVDGAAGTVSYQWYKEYHNAENNETTETMLTGETQSSLTVHATSEGSGHYHCFVTIEEDENNQESRRVDFYVSAITNLSVEPSDEEVFVYFGDSVDLEVTANSDAGADSLSYRWYKDSSTEHDIIENAAGNKYTVFGVKGAGACYICEVTDGFETAYAYFYVSLGSKLYAEADGSRDVSLQYNESKSLRVLVTGAADDVTYQWFKNNNELEGATAETYLLKGDKDSTGRYKCVVSDGIGTAYVYYNVSVETGLTADASVGEPEEGDGRIDYHVTVPYQQKRQLKVEASGGIGTLSYQWYRMSSYWVYDEYELEILEGAVSDTYEVAGVSGTNGPYCCKVSDDIISKFVYFDVKLDTGLKVSAEEEYIELTYGDSCVLKINASGGAGPLTYKWFLENGESEEIEGETSDSYTLPRPFMGGTYRCVVTDGVVTETIYIDVNVDTQLHITSDSGTVTDGECIVPVQEGSPIILNVSASSLVGPLRYNWYREGKYGEEIIDGAMETHYQVPKDAPAAKYYICRVNDSFTYKNFYFYLDTGLSVNSSVGETLGSHDGEWIDRRIPLPKDGKTTLSVNASGGIGALSYQWYGSNSADILNHNILSNASSNILDLQNPEYEYYYCEISDDISKKGISFYIDKDYRLKVENATPAKGQKYVSYKNTYYMVKAERNVPIELKVNASCDNDPISYQWFKDGGFYSDDVLMEGQTTDSITITPDKNVTYYCRVKSGEIVKYIFFDAAVDVDFTSNPEAGTMTITGTGEVPNRIMYYSGCMIGSDRTVTVVIENGITGLAEDAFRILDYNNHGDIGLDITIPDSVTNIPKYSITDFNGYTIRCHKGSKAYEYALKKDYNIELLPDSVSLADCTVTLMPESASFTGTEITPQITVMHGPKRLTPGTDYTVTTANNINAGTATVTIKGKGDYTGEIKKTFTIAAQDISKASVTLSQTDCTYNGKEWKPSVTSVKLGNVTLVPDKDYTIAYAQNTDIGTAKALIKGIGNYTGTAEITFSITAAKNSVYTADSCQYKITGSSEVSFAGLKNSKTTKLTIPKTVNIGGKTFKVTSIANKAFKKTNITTLTISDSIKTIGNSAFEGCGKLKKVTIGKDVTKIGGNAFKNCKKLGSITIKSTKLKSVGKNALKGIKSNAKIKVPSKKLKSYQKLFKGKGQGKKVKIIK